MSLCSAYQSRSALVIGMIDETTVAFPGVQMHNLS